VGSFGLYVSGCGLVPVAGTCEHGNEPSGSIEDGEFNCFTSSFSMRTLLHS
jgi:hypothetical protein